MALGNRRARQAVWQISPPSGQRGLSRPGRPSTGLSQRERGTLRHRRANPPHPLLFHRRHGSWCYVVRTHPCLSDV